MIRPPRPVQRLYVPASPLLDLLYRFIAVVALMALICLLLWVERDGLQDDRGSPVGLLDILYFAVVTVTTVGYGDIVPVSNDARMIVTFGVTPLRLGIWLIFLSTAYQLLFRQQLDQIQLALLKRFMKNHTIVCGFGVKGRSAVEELVDRGMSKERIIVVDAHPNAVAAAVEYGLRAVQGDATSEGVLRDAVIETASTVIIAPHRDDDCVLICLTAKDLNPKVRVIAAAREEENIKLIYRSGADTVVSPASAGGRLLAAATESPVSATFLEDLIRHGFGTDVHDRRITEEEAGLCVHELSGLENKFVLGVLCNGKRMEFDEIKTCRLHPGDVVVVVETAAANKAVQKARKKSKKQ
jgi:voltage-gated potassium channel